MSENNWTQLEEIKGYLFWIKWTLFAILIAIGTLVGIVVWLAAT